MNPLYIVLGSPKIAKILKLESPKILHPDPLNLDVKFVGWADSPLQFKKNLLFLDFLEQYSMDSGEIFKAHHI